MHVRKDKLRRRRSYFTLLILFGFILSVLSGGMGNIRADELTGEEPVETVEPVAEVIWTGIPEEMTIPNTTLKLMSGEIVVESIDVTDGSPVVKFTPVVKFNDTGEEILYSVSQVPLENFTTDIRDFVVDNTYVGPVVAAKVVEEPVVEEPVVEEPVVEEPVIEPKVEEPVVEEPVIETKVEEPVVEEPVIEPKVEEPVVEEPVIELKVEEPVVEEPVIELKVEEPVVEPKVEEPVVEPKVEEPVVELKAAELTKAAKPVAEIQATEETDMVAYEALAAPDFQVMAASYEYDIINYFEATGTSTNDHYSVTGVFIGIDNNVYLILDNSKATAQQYRFYDPMLNGHEADGYDLSWQNYQAYWDGATSSPYTTSVTINYPDATSQTITGTRMFIFNLGPMTDKLMATNTLQMLNSAGGFSIVGMTFTLDLGHSIVKVVSPTTPTTATIGEEVIYTITVTNTGDFQISGMDVLDTVPNGITILKVSKDGGATWQDPVYTDGTKGTLVLDTNKTLIVGTPLVYKVRAYVNTDAEDGVSLTNAAYTGGNVVTQRDTATVTVRAVDVTVTKKITGNMGVLSDTFNFTLSVSKGTTSVYYPGETTGFNLGHNDSDTMKDLPTDGVVKLSEESMGYVVTVKVGGVVIEPDNNGYYTIALSGVDITIDVVNNKEVIIPTGVQLDAMPYILILILLGAASFSGIFWKRKRLNFD